MYASAWGRRSRSATSIRAGRTQVELNVKVEAEGVYPVDGEVRITVEGKGTVTIALQNGRAVWRLGTFDTAGGRDVEVEYLGSSPVESGTESAVITVKP